MSYFEYSHVVPLNKVGFYQERVCVKVIRKSAWLALMLLMNKAFF